MWWRLGCVALAVVYFWLYPCILLVPQEYRIGYWSVEYNVLRQGLIAEREIYEIDSLLHHRRVYRVTVLTNGNPEHFWVADVAMYNRLAKGELASFETRGRVMVLAKVITDAPPIVSLLN